MRWRLLRRGHRRRRQHLWWWRQRPWWWLRRWHLWWRWRCWRYLLLLLLLLLLLALTLLLRLEQQLIEGGVPVARWVAGGSCGGEGLVERQVAGRLLGRDPHEELALGWPAVGLIHAPPELSPEVLPRPAGCQEDHLCIRVLLALHRPLPLGRWHVLAFSELLRDSDEVGQRIARRAGREVLLMLLGRELRRQRWRWRWWHLPWRPRWRRQHLSRRRTSWRRRRRRRRRRRWHALRRLISTGGPQHRRGEHDSLDVVVGREPRPRRDRPVSPPAANGRMRPGALISWAAFSSR